jgi:hypothetical protein
MDHATHLGLDVHKDTVAVAILRFEADGQLMGWGASSKLFVLEQSGTSSTPRRRPHLL